MRECNCPFENWTWNIFAAGIPERVWSRLACLREDKNRPQLSSNLVQLSLFLSFFVSCFPLLSYLLFSFSPRGHLLTSQSGNLNWPLSIKKKKKKWGWHLTQHLIKGDENKVVNSLLWSLFWFQHNYEHICEIRLLGTWDYNLTSWYVSIIFNATLQTIIQTAEFIFC